MGTCFLYGSGGSGGGTGGTLTVTTPGAGITVTAAKDGKTKTKVSGADGTAVFKGLGGGDWAIAITDGSQTAQKTVAVTTDYAVALTFFAATINVTYPAGSVCTATDGVTTLTAFPDTSGVWECTVPNAGTWTVTCTAGSEMDSDSVSITANGQTAVVELYFWHGELLDGSNLYEKHTGGFVIEADYGSYNVATITKTSSGLKVSCNNDNIYMGRVRTVKKIDLTGKNKLHADVTVSSDFGDMRIYADTTVAGKPQFTAQTAFTSSGTVTVDISGLSGECYVGVICFNNVANKRTSDITVKKVWIE